MVNVSTAGTALPAPTADTSVRIQNPYIEIEVYEGDDGFVTQSVVRIPEGTRLLSLLQVRERFLHAEGAPVEPQEVPGAPGICLWAVNWACLEFKGSQITVDLGLDVRGKYLIGELAVDNDRDNRVWAYVGPFECLDHGWEDAGPIYSRFGMDCGPEAWITISYDTQLPLESPNHPPPPPGDVAYICLSKWMEGYGPVFTSAPAIFYGRQLALKIIQNPEISWPDFVEHSMREIFEITRTQLELDASDFSLTRQVAEEILDRSWWDVVVNRTLDDGSRLPTVPHDSTQASLWIDFLQLLDLFEGVDIIEEDE